VLIAHLSDSHLRDDGDVVWLERQLDRIAARHPDHLAITGDLLDRWNPPLLVRAIDAIERRGLLHKDRVTILHGNHDLASSGGHPRRNADLWRLVLRSWDPPPLLTARRRRFYQTIAARAEQVGSPAPFLKTLANGARVAVLDSVTAPWRPLTFTRRAFIIQHAMGCIRSSQARWLRSVPQTGAPLITLVHHCPLDVPPYQWVPPWPPRGLGLPQFAIAMHIPDADRERFWAAAAEARTSLVLCGHVHRTRMARVGEIAVGVNGQSGAAWAGRTIAWYELGRGSTSMTTEQVE
jgi:predicted phosphodiesterase